MRKQKLKLKQKLSSFDTPNGKVGTGLTIGNDGLTTTADGDKIKAGKFTVLWFEGNSSSSGEAKSNGHKKSLKHLKRRMIRITNGNRDSADQIIEQISRITGPAKDG